MTDRTSFVQYASPINTLQAVRERATEAVLLQSGLNHPALTAEVRRRFGSTDVEAGALVQEPVLEAAFPYVAGDETLDSLAGTLLHSRVVDALTENGPQRNYTFPRGMRPYRHQLEAWTRLTNPRPQSVLVTSGTGSGKTECFLVPLLHDLAREVDQVGHLSGVRAIALYPLNALIASQEERLREWTAPFKGRIRFGLYNGNMREDEQGEYAPPEQVMDRRTLRSDPPPILVTNVTMLEYMTVRKEDRPLIENSRGKLRWIILDEAHSYAGSNAAEIALLIRRVLLAFGVTPADVRFVATSATIGEGNEVAEKLQRFLGDVAGLPKTQVHVVVGERSKPSLPVPASSLKLIPKDLESRDALSRNPVVQEIMRKLGEGPMTWATFGGLAARAEADPEALMRALAAPTDGGEPILPLRVHGFMRSVPGLWVCLAPECSGKPEGDWPFGAILPERVDACPHCEGVTFEIVNCSSCGEPFLDVLERGGRLIQTNRPGQDDGFAAATEREAVDDEEEATGEAEDSDTAPTSHDVNRLVATRKLDLARPLHIVPSTGIVCDAATDNSIKVMTHEREGDHCPACHVASGLRPFRFGAPFLISNAAPVLLEGVPPRPPRPERQAPLPSEGRQLLSFTDSRQGTARFAAALQGASERNFVRAVIYHAVQGSLRHAPGTDERIAKLDKDIADLEAAVRVVPSLAGQLAEKKEERAKLSSPSSDGLPWVDVRNALAERPEVYHWMHRIWAHRDPRDKRYLEDPNAFPEFLMLRELARRPRQANSIETLGLARLRFPHIDNLAESYLPPAFRDRGLTVERWREFLYLLLTVSIRSNYAIRMDPGDARWLITRRFPKVILGPDTEKTYARELSWPVARGTGPYAIPVRLLERVLGLSVESAKDRAEINDTLREAWRSLFPLFHKPGRESQYALELRQAYVAPVHKAYLCPVSRRLLDVTCVGISPYGLDGSSRFARTQCEIVEMPVHPNPALRAENGGAAVVQEWLGDDPVIGALRARGLWGNLHDRISLGSPYLQSAEHSAQQPPLRLRRYESEFKAGEINILNCSTTMEMGVDIGSVSTVMMTNVPPSIANYRQRVGRAGRRGQGFALSLTYARDTPLDREAFRKPAAYLMRQVEAPKVTLDSRRIVQRHVNALLLSTWFHLGGGEAMRMKTGDFFGCPAEIGAKRKTEAPVTEFKEWAVSPSARAAMAMSVETLVRNSVLVGDDGVYMAAKEAVEDAEKEFVREWDGIQNQAAGMDRHAARASLGFQLKRMCGEHLLGELADRGFLPGHGFPTAVVPFVNKDEPDADERDKDSKDKRFEDNRFLRRSYPTRNLDVAIRDYAPGAEVVVNGLVYRSAGVTLNWKRPAGESAVGEIQSLKWFWQCPRCGAADTSHLRPEHCTGCGADDALTIKHFLQPAGFTVDIREKPHAEIDRVEYVEPEPERVAARGAAWKPFLDPTRGRLRASRDGLVFYSSTGGVDSRGYAVCLECGRAEAEHFKAEEVGKKRPLADHKPLRYTKADVDGTCPGNGRGFAIQTGLALGHDITTDVAEIQPRGLTDPNAAWALASALREALARRLGIEASELGLAVSPRDNPVGGRTHSIFVYDRASGGAGFAPRLIELFEDLLRDARGILDCKQPGCRGGCSACILTGDLHSQAETVDRRAALAFVDAELSDMGSPAPIDMAAATALLARDVADELTAAAKGPDDVTLWPATPFDAVSLTRPRIRALLDNLTRAGQEMTLCIAPDALASLDAAQRLGLRDAAVRHGLRLAVGLAPRYPNGAQSIAALGSGRIWASRDVSAAQFGDTWGTGTEAPIVHFVGTAPEVKPIDKDSLLPKQGTRFLEVLNQFDGPSMTFGERFIDHIKPELEKAGFWQPGRLVAVEYMDRYVRSPLTVHLLIGAISRLVSHLSKQGPMPFRLTTAELKDDDRTPHRVSHDWQVEADRRKVIEAMASQSGLTLEMMAGKGLHSRRLKLVYDDAEATIILDQGFGFLKAEYPPRFDFNEPAMVQAKRLSETNIILKAEGATYLVIVNNGSSA